MTDSEMDDVKMMQAEGDLDTFIMLAAFYNVNPDGKIIEAVKNIEPGDIDDEELKSALEKIVSYAEKTDPENEESLIEMKRDWTRLFRGVTPDYGPKPPYEQLHTASAGLDLLSVLAKIYVDNGYDGYEALGNRHDYLGVELDFLTALSGKRVEALGKNDEEEYDKYTVILEEFIDGHIAPWFPSFYEGAMKEAETDFYKGVLELTRLIFEK